jgi:hypothetical protein
MYKWGKMFFNECLYFDADYVLSGPAHMYFLQEMHLGDFVINCNIEQITPHHPFYKNGFFCRYMFCTYLKLDYTKSDMTKGWQEDIIKHMTCHQWIVNLRKRWKTVDDRATWFLGNMSMGPLGTRLWQRLEKLWFLLKMVNHHIWISADEVYIIYFLYIYFIYIIYSLYVYHSMNRVKQWSHHGNCVLSFRKKIVDLFFFEMMKILVRFTPIWPKNNTQDYTDAAHNFDSNRRETYILGTQCKHRYEFE